jgi:carbon monoxide dehydrogenase subunit G
MRLENRFEVPTSAESAWKLLNDVPSVVPCMPGAELTEIVDANRWKATMHVKLGPIALQFGTDIEREEVDETTRRVVLSANARELRGRGRAQARIESNLSEVEGATEVTILTDLSLQGTVAQFGRGIVADVSSQLTKQFADCIAGKLAIGDRPPAAFQEPVSPPAREKVKPIGGLRLGLAAVWRRLHAPFCRAPQA